ncbi:MAG: acetamidase/formamidase family protein [Bdellovibrionales bacterium]|nr:acetamidase/formamidase family protein [Bdellovibrionales bacterium]
MIPVTTIHHSHSHLRWDRSLPPVLHVSSGECIEFDAQEASGGVITPQSMSSDILNLDSNRANPVTGPVFIDGAEPGDVLAIEMLDFALSGWGWTALIPGFGLLSDDFPDPFLHITKHDEERVEFLPSVTIPTAPFPGTIGVAPETAGTLPLLPPFSGGGNIDVCELVRGSTLYLPVFVPGALLSLGDTHAAQGFGEVFGTAIESPMCVRVRVRVEKNFSLATPAYERPEPGGRFPSVGGSYSTMGIESDLFEAARSAIRRMIEYIVQEYGLSEELAYCLCSVAVHLKLGEVVNAPRWVVIATLSRQIFTSASPPRPAGSS